MSLINVIVNSPDELRVRVLLRNELFALGLDDGLLSSIANMATSNEILETQLDTFSFLLDDGIINSDREIEEKTIKSIERRRYI